MIKEKLKQEIYKLSALTDRGQRLNKLISPIYLEKLTEINKLVNDLKDYSDPITEEIISGSFDPPIVEDEFIDNVIGTVNP